MNIRCTVWQYRIVSFQVPPVALDASIIVYLLRLFQELAKSSYLEDHRGYA